VTNTSSVVVGDQHRSFGDHYKYVSLSLVLFIVINILSITGTDISMLGSDQ